jgi:hypothetical protein
MENFQAVRDYDTEKLNTQSIEWRRYREYALKALRNDSFLIGLSLAQDTTLTRIKSKLWTRTIYPRTLDLSSQEE